MFPDVLQSTPSYDKHFSPQELALVYIQFISQKIWQQYLVFICIPAAPRGRVDDDDDDDG